MEQFSPPRRVAPSPPRDAPAGPVPGVESGCCDEAPEQRPEQQPAGQSAGPPAAAAWPHMPTYVAGGASERAAADARRLVAELEGLRFRRAHPELLALDDPLWRYEAPWKLEYAGWQADVERLERSLASFVSILNGKVQALHRKQGLHIARVGGKVGGESGRGEAPQAKVEAEANELAKAEAKAEAKTKAKAKARRRRGESETRTTTAVAPPFKKCNLRAPTACHTSKL